MFSFVILVKVEPPTSVKSVAAPIKSSFLVALYCAQFIALEHDCASTFNNVWGVHDALVWQRPILTTHSFSTCHPIEAPFSTFVRLSSRHPSIKARFMDWLISVVLSVDLH